MAAAAADGDVDMQGSADGSSSSSGASNASLFLEAGTGSVGQLVKLKQLLLDHMNPDWTTLAQLPELEWLEVKVGMLGPRLWPKVCGLRVWSKGFGLRVLVEGCPTIFTT
jgi:hypothetical protein